MRERQIDLLERDLDGIEAFLDEFDPPANGETRTVETNAAGELVIVRNFPLPDGCNPDYIDLLLMTHQYPSAPPVGIYILENNNAEVIADLGRTFNVMHAAAYSAPTVEGYRWVCFIHQGNRWRFNHHDIVSGDNLRKFLIGFYHQCGTERGHGH